jgi:H3 lysine-79-specific histone-lysine N-methyltransferase
VELEFPNTNASETWVSMSDRFCSRPDALYSFVLLAPKDKDHYDPILCLKQSLLSIVQRSFASELLAGHLSNICPPADYLTPEQRSLFGTLPNNNLLATDDDYPTRSPTPSNGDSQIFCLPRLACLEAHPPSVNYLKTLQRAITKQDGPLFMKTMTSVNAILRVLKYPPLPDDPLLPPGKNALKQHVETWSPTGMPRDVSLRLIEETYQRCVGPQVHSLRNYEAFSSETYGELMPSLVAEIVRHTGLGENSLFLDLGCGVGNVVLQASLQTGCRSFGIEVMPAPAGMARAQLEQLKIRARMWGVNMGDVELEEGDMLKSERVAKLMSEADVVLINNKVFKESRKPTFSWFVQPVTDLFGHQ